MELHSNGQNPHGLKDLVVKLERCDKIWKTLQLIRSLQDKHLEDIQDWIKREPIASESTIRKEPPMTFIPDKTLPLNLIGEPNLPRPYIKYQPIFNNGNESLPQFQLSEKSRVNLYHCEVCSKEYCDYKRFTDHQEVVHRIVIPKKLVAKKEKIHNNKSNGDLKSRRNSNEIYNHSQFNRKSVSNENIDLQTVVRNTSPQADSIKCKLCNRYFKNVKKHMVDYHKIKCIGVLSKVTDQNSNLAKEQSSVSEFESVNHTLPKAVEDNPDQTEQNTSQNVNLSIQNLTNVIKRKLSMPSVGLKKRFRSLSSREEESDTGSHNEQFKCEICGKEYANYKTLCKHRDRHKNRNEEKQPLEVNKNVDETVDPASRQKTSTEIGAESVQDKDNDNNNVDKKLPRTKSSLTKDRRKSEILENGSVESSEKKENNILPIKCACGRTFRTTSILSSHKTGCKFLSNTETSKSSDTRSGSDRDSGISITIKKKNNSYEIVSKDGSDEEPSRNCENVQELAIYEETSDSSSDNSDGSEFDDQLESLVPEASKYSEHHRILKLKLAEEDVDVDVEEYLLAENSSTAAQANGNHVSAATKKQVPLLRVLCKNYLIQKGVMPKDETSHKCQTCKLFLGSKERLSKHVERHKKLMKRSCSCGIKFNGMKAFDDHIAAVHPKCVSCPYCYERYRSIVGLGEHVCIVTQGKPYTETFNETHPCPNCNIAFNNITWLDSHMRSKHLDPNLPFQCYQCLEKFPNEIARDLHSHEKHNHVSACSVCNQKFQSVKTRQKHEAYHRGVGFPCHDCKKTYRLKRHQVNHVKTVHSDFSNDKLSCFICQKSIKTKSFRKHVLRHNSILECEICKKVVYNFRTLERHIMDRHENENYPRQECNTCGMLFLTKEQLEAHIMVVKNERYKNV